LSCADPCLPTSVLFASVYRFTTIMQFDKADTTWTLAEACTWCVVEVACGVIGACLPMMRPLMTKVSSQFGSIRSKNGSKTGASRGQGRTHGTDFSLVTIGGTGTKSPGGPFKRLQDHHYGVNTVITRSDSHSKENNSDSGSGDEVPLKDGIRIQTSSNVSWYSSPQAATDSKNVV
jgi:hypothetical protein